MTTSTLTPADSAANVPLCADCIEHQGLCVAHERGVLPQLAQPHWYRLIGTPLRDEKPIKDESSEVLRVKRRNARRLERAMRGEFTRSTKAAA